MPLTRPVDGDESNALTRIIGSQIFADPQASIDAVDVVSHRSSQVSFLPSRSRDQEYLCERNRGQVLDPDAFLAAFPGDWRDHTQLPMRSDEKSARPSSPGRKMEDPREKQGLIGAFCRAYDVEAGEFAASALGGALGLTAPAARAMAAGASTLRARHPGLLAASARGDGSVRVAAMLAGVYASFFLDSAPAPTVILILTAIFGAAFLRRQRQIRRAAATV